MAETDRIHDVLVVGAGIIGAAIALELADRGLSVACVGQPATTPGTASAAAGAMLGVLGEVTADQHHELDDAELLLRRDAANAWPAFAERIHTLTGHPVTIQHGTVVIANLTNTDDQANLAAIKAAAHRLGLPHEMIDPADVAYLAPAPEHQPTGALWLPCEGSIDTSRALPAIHAALQAHPTISYLTHEVTQILHDDARVTGALLRDGTRLAASEVVLAAGIATQRFLDQLAPTTGVAARLLPGKGTSFTLTDPGHDLQHVIRTPNRDFACGTHLIPRPAGGLYLGATNRIADTPAATDQPTSGEIHALIHSAIHEVNTRIRTVAFTRATHGRRPLSTDGHPLIGATGLPGLLLATGTYRNGILLAPAIADLIATTITDTTPAQTPFAPTAAWRTHAPDLHALLARGVPHIVSFIKEPGGRLPYDRQRELERVLYALFRLAFTTDHDPDLQALRDRCSHLLGSARVPETIPQVFYELAGLA